MPGNDFGERIHNFFGQDGVSQDQHQSQVVDGSWSSFSNGLVGNQKQIDSSVIANYSTHLSVDAERGQSSNQQQPVRSDYSLGLQPTNGYLHGNHMLQASPNEANFPRVDAESSRDKFSARGFTPDLHKIPMRLEMGESPVNYDFFGGQQQSNTQLPGKLQPLPRQQMTFNDMQLLKQQIMVKQMYEYQMQQQLQKQQLEARQFNSLNSNGSRSNDNQSHPLINGIPLQDASSNCWQPDLMKNTNWMHHGISPGVQGSSSGPLSTPEHGQASLVAQNLEPSLYGMPVGGANAPQNAISSVQMNMLDSLHGSANMSSSLTNQPTAFLTKGDVHDSNILPRSTYQERLSFSHRSAPGSNNRPSFEKFQQEDSSDRFISMQDKLDQMEGFSLSEKSYMKVPENINALQKSTTLDPTEEKFLFGSDHNLWDAFGNSIDMSMTGNLMSSRSDLYDACPSLQSGSWSALMQSAVAETSSDDAGVHGWGSKQQSVWATNNTAPHANAHIGSRTLNALSERLHSDSTRTAVQHLHDEGNLVSYLSPLEKPMGQHSQMAGNISHSSSSGIDGQSNSYSIRKNTDVVDRFGIWKAASNPNSDTLTEQKNHFTQTLQMQRDYGFGIAGSGNDSSASRDVQGNIKQHVEYNSVEKAIPQLKSRDGTCLSNNVGKQMAESNEIGNTVKENSNESFRSKFSQQSLKENTQVNAPDLSVLPGGKETQFGHVGNRASIGRKFQYHPMGNVDVSDEPYRKKLSHLPPTSEQVTLGNQGYFGQSKSLGQPAMNMQIESEHVSQNNMNCTNEAFKGMSSENCTSASADRSVDRCDQVKRTSSRQTMLELLDKVDQSQEHSLETSVSGISEAKTYAESGGQFRHSPSSASQGFSLQLAPPSQSLDNVQFSQNSLQPLNSLHTASEKGRTSQSRFAPWESNQSFPQQGPSPRIAGENNITSGFPNSRGYNQKQLMPVASRDSAANHLVTSSFELSTQVKERDECSDTDERRHSVKTPSLLNPTTHNNKGGSAEEFPMLSASEPLVASSLPLPSSSGMMSDSQADISASQHRFWKQPSKPQPDILRPHLLSSNNTERRFSRLDKTNQLSSQNGGNVSLSGMDMVNMHELKSKDLVAKQTSDIASMFSEIGQSNLQSFGCSLAPNNLPKENILHNEHMARTGEGDSPKPTVKRFEENVVDVQKVDPKGEQQSDGLVGDGLVNKESLKHMLNRGQTVSHSFSNKNFAASALSDIQQISPQMAPSWYNQYGTFKNGLMQPMNNTGSFTPKKIREQFSNTGSSVDGSNYVQSSKQLNTADPGNTVHVQQMPGSTQGAESPSSESLPQAAPDKLLKVDKPKKRKTAASELLPWNKEVMQGPHRLTTLGEAEVDWARATNRFVEKVEFETLIEDAPPIKLKRRLVHTTQFIQQLFSPPSPGVISLVASSNYESVAYTATRVALGDACSSSSADRIERFSPLNSTNLLSERTETEKISDQYISKAAEDFVSRRRKLETDFAGLENGTTFSDLSVEVQDLERFAVINRFARFHPSSSSMDRNVTSIRLIPQRYVTVAPIPRNIPDRVQCLSL